jgi:hypothetical protein
MHSIHSRRHPPWHASTTTTACLCRADTGDGALLLLSPPAAHIECMVYALVAVDLDGTLLQWASQEERDAEASATPSVSAANSAALRRVNPDATVVVATGRGPASASRVADDVLGLPCPLVCNNGACVLSAPDAASGRRRLLQGTYYPQEFVAGVARVGGSANTLVCVYHPDPESPSGCAISYCVRSKRSVHGSGPACLPAVLAPISCGDSS